jgi:cytochrome c556
MKPLILTIAVMAVVLSVCTAVARAADLSPDEARQIEALIDMVERLTDAAFIRNGRPYDAAAAASFSAASGGTARRRSVPLMTSSSRWPHLPPRRANPT